MTADSRRPFVVIYKWTIDPAYEAEFRDRWREATLRLRSENGGLGSCLTRNEAGDFVGIALWPNEAAREAAFAGRPPGEPRPGLIAFEETRLWVEEDLWVSSPFQS